MSGADFGDWRLLDIGDLVGVDPEGSEQTPPNLAVTRWGLAILPMNAQRLLRPLLGFELVLAQLDNLTMPILDTGKITGNLRYAIRLRSVSRRVLIPPAGLRRLISMVRLGSALDPPSAPGRRSSELLATQL